MSPTRRNLVTTQIALIIGFGALGITRVRRLVRPRARRRGPRFVRPAAVAGVVAEAAADAGDERYRI